MNLRTIAFCSLWLCLFAAFQQASAEILITKKGSRFDVEVRDRTEEGLIVLYKNVQFLVRWRNIEWISGTTIFTMENGKKLILYAIEKTDGGWRARPNWMREGGGSFIVPTKLVKSMVTPVEIEREYVQRRAKLNVADSRQQFELLKWCIAHGRDDLAVAPANALRETQNVWNLAVVMQATLLGIPKSEIPKSDDAEKKKVILRTIYRLVVLSRYTDDAASVGYKILAFDLASGQIDTHSEATRKYLQTLYNLASLTTKASSYFEDALKNSKQMITCPKCKGTGKMRGRYLGQGTDERLGALLSEGKALDVVNGFEMVTCTRCNGLGKVMDEKEVAEGPAGVKSAIGPELWAKLYDAVEKYLDAAIPVELKFLQVKKR